MGRIHPSALYWKRTTTTTIILLKNHYIIMWIFLSNKKNCVPTTTHPTNHQHNNHMMASYEIKQTVSDAEQPSQPPEEAPKSSAVSWWQAKENRKYLLGVGVGCFLVLILVIIIPVALSSGGGSSSGNASSSSSSSSSSAGPSSPESSTFSSSATLLMEYEVTVSEDGNCQPGQSIPIDISCSGGSAVLLPDPEHTCQQIGESVIRCPDLLTSRGVTVGCFTSPASGFDSNELSVRTPESSTHSCGFVLDSYTTTTGSAVWVHGGETTLRVAAIPVCGNTDASVQMGCITGTEDSSDGCTQTDSCRTLYQVGPTGYRSGSRSCQVTLDEIQLLVTSSTGNAACLQEMTLGAAVGETCRYNANCASNVCVQGTCRSQLGNAGDTCDLTNQCTAGLSCRPEWNATQTTGVCCDQTLYVNETTGVEYCPAPVGRYCPSNEACQSGKCVLGQCSDQGLPDAYVCEHDADCQSGACAVSFPNNTKACCADGNTFVLFETFCQGVPDLMECRDDMSCANGTCASRYSDGSGTSICCPGGQRNPNNSRQCGNRETGFWCSGDNDVCASGLCIFGSCSDEKSADLESCSDDIHCVNGTCASIYLDGSGSSICCPGGQLHTNGRTCAGMPVGSYCSDTNEICASGICLYWECADERRPDLQYCTEDEDCASGKCAATYNDGSGSVFCCIDGATTPNGRACANMPTGSPCGYTDEICASGECVSWNCA